MECTISTAVGISTGFCTTSFCSKISALGKGSHSVHLFSYVSPVYSTTASINVRSYNITSAIDYVCCDLRSKILRITKTVAINDTFICITVVGEAVNMMGQVHEEIYDLRYLETTTDFASSMT
ncbi:unnamed protein product [Leptidea sinapis]|uniref:Uncharacterized protein n=1 Tax=Leptidea sinapis TaxID=189913 RepID=A0A5E4Q1F7_9NEOP|nr:unnamed protein product [Leptidea sinapis]